VSDILVGVMVLRVDVRDNGVTQVLQREGKSMQLSAMNWVIKVSLSRKGDGS